MLVGRSRHEAVRKVGTEVGDIAGQPPWEDAVAARVIEGVRNIFWLPKQLHRRRKLAVALHGGTIVGIVVGLGRKDIPVS